MRNTFWTTFPTLFPLSVPFLQKEAIASGSAKTRRKGRGSKSAGARVVGVRGAGSAVSRISFMARYVYNGYRSAKQGPPHLA